MTAWSPIRSRSTSHLRSAFFVGACWQRNPGGATGNPKRHRSAITNLSSGNYNHHAAGISVSHLPATGPEQLNKRARSRSSSSCCRDCSSRESMASISGIDQVNTAWNTIALSETNRNTPPNRCIEIRSTRTKNYFFNNYLVCS